MGDDGGWSFGADERGENEKGEFGGDGLGVEKLVGLKMIDENGNDALSNMEDNAEEEDVSEICVILREGIDDNSDI